MSGRVVRSLSTALTLVMLGAMALYLAATLDLFPHGSLVSGASYCPPSWLLPGVVLAAAANLAARARSLCRATLAGYLAVVAVGGDFSLPSLQTRPRPGGPESQTLSVLALNVRYYSFGRGNVLRAIQETGADVALLSENVLTPAQAEEFRREARPYDFWMGRSGETAILSRFPVLEFQEVELPSHQASLSRRNQLAGAETTAHRSFVHAVIDVRGVPVNVISIRLIAGRPPADDPLSQLEWGGYLLRVQAKEVAFFEQYLTRVEGPLVFGGDLNATPSSFAIRRLAALARDSHLATNNVGWPTFRVAVPLTRLDYLFASSELAPVEVRRLDVVVSDHFPVLAEYRLASAQQQTATVLPAAGPQQD